MSVALLLPACSTSSDEAQRQDHQLKPEARLTGTMPQRMRNCPSAVPSAKTTARPTADGVNVTITSTDPQARAEIVRLAAVQSGQRNPLRLVPPHSGLHGGPGTMGRCPIIHANTTVRYQAIPDGVRIHVAARAHEDVPALQEATEARARTFATPSS